MKEFVDEHQIVRSVPEDRVAYHCGGAYYYHPECRNGNSIGVEICTKYVGGTYAFAPEALDRAKTLIRDLMKRYEIPAERVIRHFDVTHKVCPAPFCGTGEPAWREFKGGLTVYQNAENVPVWAKPTVEKLMTKDLLLGDEKGNLNLSQDMTRLLVILDRAGVFDR
jgi:N-acetylmuramoyl-L-alanine amidase CwlA